MWPSVPVKHEIIISIFSCIISPSLNLLARGQLLQSHLSEEKPVGMMVLLNDGGNLVSAFEAIRVVINACQELQGPSLGSNSPEAAAVCPIHFFLLRSSEIQYTAWRQRWGPWLQRQLTEPKAAKTKTGTQFREPTLRDTGMLGNTGEGAVDCICCVCQEEWDYLS